MGTVRAIYHTDTPGPANKTLSVYTDRVKLWINFQVLIEPVD